jgi:hypothetical protein
MSTTTPRSSGLASFFAIAAILLAITGQVLLAGHEYAAAGVGYATALVAWLLALRHGAATRSAVELGNAGEASRPLHRLIRISLVPVSLVLASLTFLTSTNNTFTLVNVALWVLSIVTFLLAFGERGTTSFDWRNFIARFPRAGVFISWRTFVLVAVLLLGAFFYYYHLSLVPAEMTSDHAEKLLDIHDILTGKRPIFFERNTGREALSYYLVAAFVGLTQHRPDHMALKWVSATVGFLVVPLTFWLGRELFGDLVGWLAAAFVAIGEWGVGIARMGLRFPFTPFFTALTFIFLFRALKYQRRNDYLLTGLALGAGLYGYHAFKIVPLVVAGCFGLWLLLEDRIGALRRGKADWQELRRYAANVLLVVLLSLLVFMPFLRYMTEHPEAFWYRVLTRMSNEERPLPGNPVVIFADNMKNALLMFNVQGDHSWPNTLSDVPVLDEVSGGLFVLGVAYALYRLLRHRETAYGYVLAVVVGLLLPSALALAFPIENPSVVRAGGAIPFVCLLIALPLAQLGGALKRAFGAWGVGFATVAIVGLVLVSAQLNYTRYFVLFDRQYRQYSWNSSEMAATMLDWVRGGGSLDHAWVVAYPYWVDTRNVAINLGNIEWNNVVWHVKQDLPDPSSDPAPRLFILSPEDKPNLQDLDELFPDGWVVEYQSRTPGKEYLAFYVPGKAAWRPAQLSGAGPGQ